jgi:hypothetical protein
MIRVAILDKDQFFIANTTFVNAKWQESVEGIVESLIFRSMEF